MPLYSVLLFYHIVFSLTVFLALFLPCIWTIQCTSISLCLLLFHFVSFVLSNCRLPCLCTSLCLHLHFWAYCVHRHMCCWPACWPTHKWTRKETESGQKETELAQIQHVAVHFLPLLFPVCPIFSIACICFMQSVDKSVTIHALVWSMPAFCAQRLMTCSCCLVPSRSLSLFMLFLLVPFSNGFKKCPLSQKTVIAYSLYVTLSEQPSPCISVPARYGASPHHPASVGLCRRPHTHQAHWELPSYCNATPGSMAERKRMQPTKPSIRGTAQRTLSSGINCRLFFQCENLTVGTLKASNAIPGRPDVLRVLESLPPLSAHSPLHFVRSLFNSPSTLFSNIFL